MLSSVSYKVNAYDKASEIRIRSNICIKKLKIYFVLLSLFFSIVFIYLSKFMLKYCERWGMSMEAASAFQLDPENTSIIFNFFWIVFQTQGFFYEYLKS